MTLIPTAGDGRNLDLRIAQERGEGATIEIRTPDEAWPVPSTAETTATTIDTYYDLPVIKAAPWRWYVPAYFYAGGLAGAAATLAPFSSGRLAQRLHWIAAAGEATGAALLIADLGRPARFHHMLRVFRPTSPMNVGVWILGAAGTSSGLALLTGNRLASFAGAVAGSMLSTYTGVLVGNTAVPILNATRRALPIWFAASSAASLASVLELVAPRRPRSYVIGAKLADLVCREVVAGVAREAGVAVPLHGRATMLWKASRWLSAASLAGTLLGRPRVAGVLGTTAALLSRFAIVEAGHASAADPRATFETQRRRLAT